MPGGLLLFDFDGTLYRGMDPFQHYADRIGETLPADVRAPYLAAARAYLAGAPGVVANDPWEALVLLAAPYGATRETLQDAFLETRRFMMTDACRLEVPAGLPELLDDLAGRVLRVVASNSPEGAAVPLLDRLGLLDRFDVVRHSSNKPDGLGPLVDDVLRRSGLPGAPGLSVGDHYVNDIAPARARGWETVHVNPRGEHPGPATCRGRILEDVLPCIRAWAARVAG